jgi:putative acetyltransferase
LTRWTVREERPGDEAAIRQLTEAAFADHPYSDGTESAIIDALRADGDLALSLVAETDDAIVGHAAFSPARLSCGESAWFTLGPLSVLPELQRRGIARALIEAGAAYWRRRGARGIVVLGDSQLYARFGFRHGAALRVEGPLGEHFQVLSFGPGIPDSTVEFAAAFGAGREPGV